MIMSETNGESNIARTGEVNKNLFQCKLASHIVLSNHICLYPVWYFLSYQITCDTSLDIKSCVHIMRDISYDVKLFVDDGNLKYC
ncbi:Hypothetical predicted protein [Octopus vulgaris]|uniref:Uncharacterized protein n=1 Tax=Octopus vulgaris TaxID=6645 RepID=A0AA36BKT0_OCTVU|nr:Hypothetical predicted protein [Octopus vulgaris]